MGRTVTIEVDDLRRLAWAAELALGHEEQLALELGGQHVAEAREFDRLAVWLNRMIREEASDAGVDGEG